MEHQLTLCLYGKRYRQMNRTLAHVTEVGVLKFQLPELVVRSRAYNERSSHL
jgi:hypothetical protein